MNRFQSTPKIQPADDTLTVRTARFLRSNWTTFARWYFRRAAAHHLNGLDDRMLKDIGIDRSEIESVLLSASEDRRRHQHF